VASGPLASPRGEATAHLTGVGFDGRPIGELRLAARADERGIHVEELRVGDRAGTLDVKGLVGPDGPRGRRLDLTVHAAGLPLSMIPRPPPAEGSRPLNLDGRLGADLRIAGTTRRPAAAGTISLAGVGVFDAALGGGTLAIDTRPDERIGVRGQLFQGKVGLDGTVALGGPTGIDARGRVTLDQLELEELFSDLADRVGARAWVSGYIDVATAPTLHAEAHLDRVRFDFEGTDAEGRPNPIIVDNRGEIIVAADVTREELHLLAPVTFVSSDGEFTVDGSAARSKLSMRLQGDVQLRLIELFTRRFIDEARGSLRVNVALGGSVARPTLDGNVTFRDAAIRPSDQEAEIRVPGGALVFSLDRLRADGVTVEVDGERVALDGSVELRALRPVSVDARVEGRLAGKLLEMVAPEQVSHGDGSAALSLTIRGPVAAPAISGLLTFDRRLEVSPRALRREIALRGGRVRLANQQVVIENVSGDVDEGTFGVSGLATLRPQLGGTVRITLDGISHRVPGVLELELGAELDLRYRGGGLRVSGDVSIIDGRFVQKLRFDQIAKSILVPAQTTEINEPFWSASPLLENMELDLDIRTTGSFEVTNEIAELSLEGSVKLTGTPPSPVFSGEIAKPSVAESTLRFPGIKIRRFAVSVAQVIFSPYYRFPETSPRFLVQADAPFVDYSGTEHKVFLEVSGTLSRIEWRLWTSTGLNQTQTLSLISTGRTPEELLGRVRGDAGSARSGTDATTGLPVSASSDSAFDEWAKEVSGELIDTLAADNLRSALGLDCLSLAVSGSSLRGSLCKKLGDLILFSVEGEQGILGFSRYELNLSARPSDEISAVIQWWGLRSEQIIERTQNELRFQLEYRFTLR
jgi:hypothetical protein